MRRIFAILLASIVGCAQAQINNPVTVQVSSFTWTPSLTGVSGTVSAVNGTCATVVGLKIYQCTVVFTGTTITVAGLGTSYFSTPFGTGNYPTLATNSSAAVSAPTLVALGGGMLQTNTNVYLPTVTVGVSSLVVSFNAFTN